MVQDDACNAHVRVVLGKPIHQGRDRMGQAGTIDHQNNGQAKNAGQICGRATPFRGGAVKQAHRAFDQQKLGAGTRQIVQPFRPHRPRIQIGAFAPTGSSMKARINIVRARLRAADVHTAARQCAQKAKGESGLAAARRGRGQNQAGWR